MIILLYMSYKKRTEADVQTCINLLILVRGSNFHLIYKVKSSDAGHLIMLYSMKFSYSLKYLLME